MKKLFNRILLYTFLCSLFTFHYSLTSVSQNIIYQTGFEDTPEPLLVPTDTSNSVNGWITNDNSIQGFQNRDDQCNRYVAWQLRNAWTIMNYTSVYNNFHSPISGNYSLGISMLFGPDGLTYYYYQPGLFCTFEQLGTFGFFSDHLDVNTDRWTYRYIPSAGYNNITVDFDWKCNTLFSNHFFGMFGYSIDGGNTFTWLNTGGDGNGLYWDSPYPVHQQLTLPAECDNNPNLAIGYRFYVDAGFKVNNNSVGPSFVVDNIVISANLINFNCDVPSSFNAAIGSPANGTQHHINLTWSAVKDAQGYQLDDSVAGGNWTNLYEGNAKTFNHNAGDNPNKQYFYRLRAYSGSTYCDYVYTNRYTACDNPSLIIGNQQLNSLSLHLAPETPVTNPAITTYSIYSQSFAKYVQADGSLAASPVLLTLAQWGTVTVQGLNINTSYCFYASAKNAEGDIRQGNVVCASTTDAPFSCGVPTNFTAVIGVPANGLSHHIYISWTGVNKADGYDLQDSVAGGNWTNLVETSNTFYDHDCGDNPNKQFFYRVRAYNGATKCNFTSPVHRYTACDNPVINTGAVSSTVINVILLPETPVANPAYTNYYIKCTNVNKFVQGDGSLGTDTVYKSLAAWGSTISVIGLVPNGITYCFAATAKNGDGDFRKSGGVCASTTGCKTLSFVSPLLSNHTKCTGDIDTLRVNLDGTFPVTYQLWKDGTIKLADASTNSLVLSYIINPVTAASAGMYKFVLTGCDSKKISDSAIVSVNQSVSITKNIKDTAICAGNAVTLSVAAIGKAPVAYSWKKNGVPVNNATNSLFKINSALSSDTGIYLCQITNECGIKLSNTAKISVNLPPAITSQPPSAMASCNGSPVTFNVNAGGTKPLQYQWTKDGTNISSATNSTYTIPNPISANAGFYKCSISNVCSNLSTTGTTLTLSDPVTITQQPPALITVCVGANVSLDINATGTNPVTYQWTLDGNNIAGATKSTYAFNDIPEFYSGKFFQCKLTNICGTNATIGTIININEPATVTKTSADQAVCPGMSATFSVDNIGVDPVTYQWYKQNSMLTGETTNQINLNNVSVSDTVYYKCFVSNFCGSDTSNIMKLYMKHPLSIASQPLNQRICPGSPAGINFTVAGSGPLYQWQKNNTSIYSATGSNFVISTFGSANAGDYICIAHNDCGAVTSNTATLSLIPALHIYPKIANKIKCPGDSTGFVVYADPTENITYQWKRGNTIIKGATNSAFVIDTLRPTDEAGYKCIVTNACTKDSAVTNLQVNQTVQIAVQPLSKKVCAGAQNISFSIQVTGTPPFSFQWVKDGNVIWFNSTYTINTAGASDAGKYYCNVFGGGGGGCGVVKSTVVSLIVNQPVSIVSQPSPANKTLCSGSNISYNVKVADTTNLTYQWYSGLLRITGATGKTLSFKNVSTNNAGTYKCVMTNACGSATSDNVTLNVTQTATILKQSANVNACQNSNAQLTITQTQGNNIEYQWEKNNFDIAGATSSTYVFNGLRPSDAGNYLCIINNSCGFDTSRVFVVYVNASISVKTNPVSQSKCIGNEVYFSVTPSDSTGSAFKWLKDNTIIPGGTSRSYNIDSATLGNSGVYECIVSNACNTVTSKPAVLTINQKPSVTGKSKNKTRCAGDTATFFVNAAGTNLSYTWLKNNNVLTGNTGSAIYFNSLNPGDEALYYCAVSNNCSSVQNMFVLVINTPPVISAIPVKQNKYIGDSIYYSLSPSGTGPFTYQWCFNGIPINGATKYFYALDSLIVNQSGSYSCMVTNICGTTSADISTINVTANEGMKIEGHLTYDNVLNSPITKTMLYMYTLEGTLKDSAITDSSGYYKFIKVENGKYFINPSINKKWGGANPADALLVNRYYIKAYTFADDLKKVAAEVNLDNKINSVDALLINRRYIAALSSFKAGNWVYQKDTINVHGSSITYNFKALCTGDVNGSYTPANGLFFLIDDQYMFNNDIILPDNKHNPKY